jgi:hypothetical protein
MPGAGNKKFHELLNEPELPPRLSPRIVATSADFEFSSFLDDCEFCADVLWRKGEIHPFQSAPAETSGFAVFLERYASKLWEQEDDLLEFCTEHFLQLSALSAEGVKLHAVLFPYRLSGPPCVELTPDLLGVLAGLGITVIIENGQLA